MPSAYLKEEYMTFDLTTFQGRLRYARTFLGLSQHGLAKSMGSSQCLVGRWEKGEATPRPDTIGRIATALQIRKAWLLLGQGPMELALINNEPPVAAEGSTSAR